MARVLIADDALPLRALLARAVRACGHEVCGEAADAQTACRLAGDVHPDVVILDGRVPPDGALALLASVRAAAPAAKLFVLASLEERALIRAVREQGAGIIERPVRTVRVGEALAACGEAPAPS